MVSINLIVPDGLGLGDLEGPADILLQHRQRPPPSLSSHLSYLFPLLFTPFLRPLAYFRLCLLGLRFFLFLITV